MTNTSDPVTPEVRDALDAITAPVGSLRRVAAELWALRRAYAVLVGVAVLGAILLGAIGVPAVSAFHVTAVVFGAAGAEIHTRATERPTSLVFWAVFFSGTAVLSATLAGVVVSGLGFVLQVLLRIRDAQRDAAIAAE